MNDDETCLEDSNLFRGHKLAIHGMYESLRQAFDLLNYALDGRKCQAFMYVNGPNVGVDVCIIAHPNGGLRASAFYFICAYHERVYSPVAFPGQTVYAHLVVLRQRKDGLPPVREDRNAFGQHHVGDIHGASNFQRQPVQCVGDPFDVQEPRQDLTRSVYQR